MKIFVWQLALGYSNFSKDACAYELMTKYHTLYAISIFTSIRIN